MGILQSTLYNTSSRKFTFEYGSNNNFWFCDQMNYPNQQDTLYKYYKVGLFGSLYTSFDALINLENSEGYQGTGITYVNSDTTIADFCSDTLFQGNSLVLYNEWQLYVLVVLIGLIGYYSRNDVTRLGLIVVGLVLLLKALGPSADHDTNYWINFFRAMREPIDKAATQKALTQHGVRSFSSKIGSEDVDVSILGPNESYPLHRHAEGAVFAVAHQDGLEYSNDEITWKPIEKNKMIQVPMNMPHAVRNNSTNDVTLVSYHSKKGTHTLKDFILVNTK